MKKFGILYIILASVLWGTSGIFVKYIEPFGITTLQMTLVRGFVAFLGLAAFVIFSYRKLFKTNVKEILLFSGSGISFFLTASCYFKSMQLTSVSTAVVLMYTAPIFVMIYSVLFLNEKINLKKIIAVLGMIFGCVFTSGIIGGFKADIIGILIGLMSGIAYASYNIITKIEMNKGINPIKANLYCFLFSTVAGVLFANPIGLIERVLINPTTLLLLCLGLGAFTCILPYFFYTLALKEIPAGTASSLGILEPMAATILSVIVLGEKLSVYSVVGIHGTIDYYTNIIKYPPEFDFYVKDGETIKPWQLGVRMSLCAISDFYNATTKSMYNGEPITEDTVLYGIMDSGLGNNTSYYDCYIEIFKIGNSYYNYNPSLIVYNDKENNTLMFIPNNNQKIITIVDNLNNSYQIFASLNSVITKEEILEIMNAKNINTENIEVTDMFVTKDVVIRVDFNY